MDSFVGKTFSAGLDIEEHAAVLREITSTDNDSSDGVESKGKGESGAGKMDPARRTFANIPFLISKQESLGSLQR